MCGCPARARRERSREGRGVLDERGPPLFPPPLGGVGGARSAVGLRLGGGEAGAGRVGRVVGRGGSGRDAAPARRALRPGDARGLGRAEVDVVGRFSGQRGHRAGVGQALEEDLGRVASAELDPLNRLQVAELRAFLVWRRTGRLEAVDALLLYDGADPLVRRWWSERPQAGKSCGARRRRGVTGSRGRSSPREASQTAGRRRMGGARGAARRHRRSREVSRGGCDGEHADGSTALGLLLTLSAPVVFRVGGRPGL